MFFKISKHFPWIWQFMFSLLFLLSLQLSIRTWSWSIDHGCGRQHRITLGSLVRIVQNLWKTPELWLWCQCQQFNWGNTYVRLFEIILYIFQKTHEIDFNNEKILELWFFPVKSISRNLKKNFGIAELQCQMLFLLLQSYCFKTRSLWVQPSVFNAKGEVRPQKQKWSVTRRLYFSEESQMRDHYQIVDHS